MPHRLKEGYLLLGFTYYIVMWKGGPSGLLDSSCIGSGLVSAYAAFRFDGMYLSSSMKHGCVS